MGTAFYCNLYYVGLSLFIVRLGINHMSDCAYNPALDLSAANNLDLLTNLQDASTYSLHNYPY